MRLQGGGVGFYPTSGSPFVHMDVGNVRAWPRMTARATREAFPGWPHRALPGRRHSRCRNYALALADVERHGNAPNTVSLAAARAPA